MPIDLILVGGGGHCVSCIDVICQNNEFKIAGVLDREDRKGQMPDTCPYVGTDKDIPDLCRKGYQFMVTVGQIKSSTLRFELFQKVRSCQGLLAVVVSPLGYVSSRASLGQGTMVMHRAIVNAGSEVGDNCIINTGAIVEHDTRIGSHCHIATSAVVNGDVCLGNHSFVGSGAVIKQGVTIGDHVIVGAGVTVLHDVTSHQIVKG